MTIFFNILLGICAAVLFIGVIGEKDKTKHTNITIAFAVVMLFILALNTII